jgi:hypothetical protein
MKKSNAVGLTAAFVIALSIAFTLSATHAQEQAFEKSQTCACSAPDGSCSISVTCSGGCTRFCGNNDNCSASCSGSYSFLATEVNLEMQNSDYTKLVNKLSRLSKKELAFSPTKPDMIFNVGFDKATLWDALKLLSDQGTVHVAGQNFEKLKKLRRTLLFGERISFGIKNTPVSTFVNDLNGLTGLPLSITAGNPNATVNVQLQDATLNEILNAIYEQTGTKIIEDPAPSD